MPNPIAWVAPPQPAIIAANEIHIYQTHLDVPTEILEPFASILSEPERQRSARMVQPHDKIRKTASASFLRQILARYLALPARALAFEAGPYGKPVLASHLNTAALSFNNSHSGDLQWVAVTRNLELGIDLEILRSNVATMEVAEHHFSPEEIRDLSSLREDQRTEGFFLCWTRKEAYLKARGIGLQLPLKSFSVTLIPQQPAILTSADSAQWSLYSIQPSTRVVGALAAQGKNHSLRFFHWPPQE